MLLSLRSMGHGITGKLLPWSNLAEANRQLTSDLERLRSACQLLETERCELRARMECLTQELESCRQVLGSPGYRFYSPIIDLDDPYVRAVCANDGNRYSQPCDHLKLDEPAMLSFAHEIARYHSEAGFPEHRQPPHRYYFENPFFSYSDAITLFGFLRHFRPKRLIEVGAGFSSCASMDTNDRFFDGKIDMTFVDPRPGTLLGLLSPDDEYRERVVPQALQEVATDRFEVLEENDILFIDSSHVSKTGSDVNEYLFRILPALRPGVIVHIHDIFYPFEYPSQWILELRRSWNEAYVLRAFLQCNNDFEIIYFNDLVYNRYRDLTQQLMPLCLRNTGGSLWLRRRDP